MQRDGATSRLSRSQYANGRVGEVREVNLRLGSPRLGDTSYKWCSGSYVLPLVVSINVVEKRGYCTSEQMGAQYALCTTEVGPSCANVSFFFFFFGKLFSVDGSFLKRDA